MLKRLIRNRLAAFDRSWGYDSRYLDDVLTADLGAFYAFSKVMALSRWRRDVPAPVYYAVKITGALAEDCGPCTQLVVDMALREGVAPHDLVAVLAGTPADEAMALGVRFARAVLARDPEADPLRDEIVRRWGRRGLVSLAFGLTSARLFPTLKGALGHARSCRRVTVGEARTIEVRAEA